MSYFTFHDVGFEVVETMGRDTRLENGVRLLVDTFFDLSDLIQTRHGFGLCNGDLQFEVRADGGEALPSSARKRSNPSFVLAEMATDG